MADHANDQRPVSPESLDPIPNPSGASVLIVDDEPQVLAMLQALLRQLGFETVTAEDPHEALRSIVAEPLRFRVIITDEAMPQMSGRELIEAIRRSKFDVPILLLSGYGDALDLNVNDAGRTCTLGKPVRLVELQAKLREVLAVRNEAARGS